MGPVLYWILFSILVALLVIFASCLVFNIIIENCLVVPEEVNKRQANENDENSRLNKYHFDKHDVEDLTRIRVNLKSDLPNVTLTNEVEKTNVDRLLKRTGRRDSSLSNIDEEIGSKQSVNDFNSVSSIHSAHAEEHPHRTFQEKVKISQSVDNLEFCDPSGIDALKEIHKVEDEAKKIDSDLDYFIGSTSDVKYYEINEKLLRLMISLFDITSESDELRKKKKDILAYIEECQMKLKSKARDAL